MLQVVKQEVIVAQECPYLDPFSGTPYPALYRRGDLPPEGMEVPGWKLKSDTHHRFFEEQDYTGDPLLEAIRQAVHELPRWAHELYHRHVPGVPISEDRFQRFRTLVFIAAGYLPPKGVRFTAAGTIEVVDLTEDQRALLRASGAIHVDNMGKVKREILSFIMSQGVTVDPELVEAFDSEDYIVRGVAGVEIIRRVGHIATAQLTPDYQKARARGRLPWMLPEQLGTFVFHLLAFGRDGEPNMDVLHWLDGMLPQVDQQRSA